VFAISPTLRGPMHQRPRLLHLGRMVSVEREADVGPDADGHNNIKPLKDRANLDKADDGLELHEMKFVHCEVKRFPVWIYVAPPALAALEQNDGIAYLNAWLDGNHDGDWADLHECPQADAPEHILIDDPVDVGALGPGLHRIWVTTTSPVYWPATTGPAWFRITLSEAKSNKTLPASCLVAPNCPYGDGRGHNTAFNLGETEDYILRPPDNLRPDLRVEKRGYVQPWFEYDELVPHRSWSVGWVVGYGNAGAAAANNVQVVDTYDTGGVPLLEQPQIHSHPFFSPTVSGNQLTFDVGTLAPGKTGYIFIRGRLPYTMTPGAILTNTVTISGHDDLDPSDNTVVLTTTIPFLPPRIVSPRPGTTCTGAFTITGRVQVVPTPTLMFVDVFIDGALHDTVNPDSSGLRHSPVTGLSDGVHEIYAVARYLGKTSPKSPVLKIVVDSSLFWSPITLQLVDQNGHLLLPTDRHGRIDETGWAVFLRPNRTYTVTVYLCCAAPSAVTWQVGSQTINLTDADGDGWYEGSFTTPSSLPANISIRICVTCSLIQRCSDGRILIDPEGTVYDLSDGQEVQDAVVACMEGQTDLQSSQTLFSQWTAGDYGQENPQTTGSDGYYSFFTPAGTYRVEVSKNGYQDYVSPDLVVVDEPVEHDVYLTPDVTGDTDHTILISELGFDPPVLSVKPGDVIEWVNVDSEVHTSTSLTPTLPSNALRFINLDPSDAWDSGLLANGESYKLQLRTPGTYTYQDGDNGEYSGQITVEYAIYLPIILR
jgi:plastocyanin